MSDTISIIKCFEDVFCYITNRPTYSDDAQEYARPYNSYDYLSYELDLTYNQSEILACILNGSIEGKVSGSSIARTMGISNLKYLTMQAEIKSLLERRLIQTNSNDIRGAKYIVPSHVLQAFTEDRIPDNSDICNLTTSMLINQMAKVFRDYWHDDMDFSTLLNEITLLYTSNPQNSLVKAFYANKLDEVDKNEVILFFFMLVRYVNFFENSFGWEDYARLFCNTDFNEDIQGLIMMGELKLMKKGLIEFCNADGLEDSNNICLPDRILKEFVGDIIVSRQRFNNENNFANIIRHDTIKVKPMFYNHREENEIKRLTSLLDKDKYKEVTARLEEKGLRKGFACLFYGMAGSGKTETCYSISVQTGRDIYFVDMAELKSKWVGDSERNVRELFKSYRKAVHDCEMAPIMVWNEVDAIFGKRRKVENAVDKMENAMQNVILQELENLEGILIATTNFSIKDGFDSAFERRFIIKVRFDMPEVDTRAKIWSSMFGDELSQGDAVTLATEFDFTGGVVENINRKSTVDYILTGQRPTLKSIRELCLAEKTEENVKKPIGF